jgi:hypothetical protein
MPVGEEGRGGGGDGIKQFIREAIMEHSRGDGEINLDETLYHPLGNKKF